MNKGQTLNGTLTFRANDSFSYDVNVKAGIDCSPRIETENMVFLQVRSEARRLQYFTVPHF